MELLKIKTKVADDVLFHVDEVVDIDSHSLTNNGIPIWEQYCPTWKEVGLFKYSIHPHPQGWCLLAANPTIYPLPTAEAIKEIAPNLFLAYTDGSAAIFYTKEEAIAVAEALLLNL